MRKDSLVVPALLVSPTVVLTLVSAKHPVVLLALRRDSAALRAGEWWRLISPVLVQPDRVWTAASVLVLVAVVSAIAVELLGWRRVLGLYLLGALVGHAVGERWLPFGAGCSVAGCGVLGAIAVRMIRRGPIQPRVAAVLLLGLAVAATILRDLHGPPLLAGALVGAILDWRPGRPS